MLAVLAARGHVASFPYIHIYSINLVYINTKWLLPDDLWALRRFESWEEIERARERDSIKKTESNFLSLTLLTSTSSPKMDRWIVAYELQWWIPVLLQCRTANSHCFTISRLVLAWCGAFINVHGASVATQPNTYIYILWPLQVKCSHTNAVIFIEQKHNQSIGFMCSNSR